MRNGDRHIFTEKNLEKVEDQLKASLIQIFLDLNITIREFTRLHREWMLRINETDNTKISSSRNNLLNAIEKKDTITYSMFELIVKNILGYNLTSMSITLRGRDGRTLNITTDRISY